MKLKTHLIWAVSIIAAYTMLISYGDGIAQSAASEPTPLAAPNLCRDLAPYPATNDPHPEWDDCVAMIERNATRLNPLSQALIRGFLHGAYDSIISWQGRFTSSDLALASFEAKQLLPLGEYALTVGAGNGSVLLPEHWETMPQDAIRDNRHSGWMDAKTGKFIEGSMKIIVSGS